MDKAERKKRNPKIAKGVSDYHKRAKKCLAEKAAREGKKAPRAQPKTKKKPKKREGMAKAKRRLLPADKPVKKTRKGVSKVRNRVAANAAKNDGKQRKVYNKRVGLETLEEMRTRTGRKQGNLANKRRAAEGAAAPNNDDGLGWDMAIASATPVQKEAIFRKWASQNGGIDRVEDGYDMRFIFNLMIDQDMLGNGKNIAKLETMYASEEEEEEEDFDFGDVTGLVSSQEIFGQLNGY